MMPDATFDNHPKPAPVPHLFLIHRRQPQEPSPPMRKITRKQFEIVSFIQDYIMKNAIPPTLYEIAEYFSIKPSTAAAHIEALERKHLLERKKGARRSIRLAGGHGRNQKTTVSVPMYARISCFPNDPDSRCSVDIGLIPEEAAQGDLFAVRTGLFRVQPHSVEPGDILVVWTRPGILRPGMMVLDAPGDTPACHTIAATCSPRRDTIGRVVAVLRSL